MGVHVNVREPPGRCPLCGGPMKVQKTTDHHGKTISHGQFEVRETIHVCAAGCRHKSGSLVTRRAASLAGQLIPGRTVGYDVMVFIGLRRFLDHFQREQIRSVLAKEHGLVLSTGQITGLARLFLDYLERLHNERCEQLRAALAEDGGWPLHIDATGEDGRGTLFVAMAGWRKWVLGAWKLSTERAELILPCLRQVVDQFGTPCAVMRDLGGPVSAATNDLLAELELDIPVLACHQHFLKDIGKDLLDPAHGHLRDLFRRMQVRPRLRTLARELGRKLGEDIAQARQEVKQWQHETGPLSRLPWGQAGIATVRSLAQWMTDYAADSTNQGFPYDRAYLDFYDRCMTGSQAIKAFLRYRRNDRKVASLLKRLQSILDPVTSDIPFGHIAQQLRARANLFDELRDALRLVPKASPAMPISTSNLPTSAGEQVQDLRDVQQQLDELLASLRKRGADSGVSRDMASAIEIIFRHIQDHGPYLWGHVIQLPEDNGGGIRLLDRTNNLLEGHFKGMKHDERRRSGRKILTHDFEQLPAQATLVYNLNHPDYVKILCGSLELLPQAFAKFDGQKRENRLHALSPFNQVKTAAIPQIASASLPIEDRQLVRNDQMKKRVVAAAKRRAPRPQNG